MNKEVILLILHILCALCNATLSIIVDERFKRSLYIFNTMLWSICIGLDIIRIIIV